MSQPARIVMMLLVRKKVFLALAVFVISLSAIYIYWAPGGHSTVDVNPRVWSEIENMLEKKHQGLVDRYSAIPYQVKESIASRVAHNGCVCEAEPNRVNVPFIKLLFPSVWARYMDTTFTPTEWTAMKDRRNQQYQNFQKRSQNAADLLLIAEANSPLQYPAQGVEVRPLGTVIIPGLGIQEPTRDHSVTLTASMGTFDRAAEVKDVRAEGDGTSSLTLSSSLLANLNRQLQFIAYTNTLFHPNTADAVQFKTLGHQSVFVVRIQYKPSPRLYNPGPKGDYNISALVTIATKTFIRYDKLQVLIESIRRYYPTVTIVIADDSEHPQPVTGPYIEHYIMPFGKGWFAGRNLAVSQVTTKYVLWVDDDFIFTANTKVEKMVDMLERTTLDLVGGAVREVTGYTATYRQTIVREQGGPAGGFDPRLARVAHLEFFIDALGSLHIGSCDDVIVSHASKIKLPWGQSESDKAYAKFRYPSSSYDPIRTKDGLLYFKNGFQCMSSN
ncbi:hypothetical protein AGOR_G00131300 [Albula goreensis]|uniref:Glycosyltransferase 2-like domain-containing protein n=1 Tax=Albula goreensis TaxID=1534307 RepID=A0A8T3DBJ4_9TELE|nr:hypothetical protein AGOR_G00131300 [Albula goreensis]